MDNADTGGRPRVGHVENSNEASNTEMLDSKSDVATSASQTTDQNVSNPIVPEDDSDPDLEDLDGTNDESIS